METTIWILKGSVALLFIFTGINKIAVSKSKLLDKGMKGLIDLDERQIKITGLLEVLGALGLILPTLLSVYPIVSLIAALCLSLTMVVAGLIHYKHKLAITPNIVMFAICILIAYCELI